MSMGGDPLLSIRTLGVTLGADRAVTIDHLDMARGEVVVLDAPSGAGKSTVLGLIAGAIAPDPHPNARHVLLGHAITPHLARHRYFAPHQVGFVLQTNALVPYLTLAENIALPLAIAGAQPDPDWHTALIGALGIADLMDRKPSAVSVGQRQRAAIARALLGRPALVLLDEPVSALDPVNVDQVERILQVLAQENETAVLLASHRADQGAFTGARRMGFETRVEGARTLSAFSAQGTSAQPLLEDAV